MKSIIFTVTNDISFDRRMERICTSLAKNGFDVTIIGREMAHSQPLPSYPFKTIRLRCIFNKGKLFYLEYNFRLFWKLLFMRADIYSAVDLDTIIPCFMAAALKRKKKVFDAHEYFEEVPEVVDRPFTKAIWKWVGKMFVPRADLAITVSDTLSEKFQQLYGIPFETIRNVPLPGEGPVLNYQNYLIYRGALNEGRGLEQMIDAMPHIDIPLMIAGEGDLSAALRKRASALNLGSKVQFLGRLHEARLHELTARAWLGFNLLENRGLSYYYSLANKFFDYIACGVPSVNMDFPEYRKINDRFQVGVLLKELSTQQIVEAVKTLKDNPALYQKLRGNCVAARDEFSWPKEEKKLLKLYSQFG